MKEDNELKRLKVFASLLASQNCPARLISPESLPLDNPDDYPLTVAVDIFNQERTMEQDLFF